MTDSNRSTMEVFTGASKVNIGNANFSSVGRDQINYYTQTTIVQTRGKKRKMGSSLPDLSETRRKKRKTGRGLPLELSEFTEIKRGDIHRTKDGVCYSWRLCSNGKDDTEAAVYHAELNITGPFGQKKFTVKTYRGRNAMKEWKRDFLRCSGDWLSDVPLFGYNNSAFPSLIFCGEFVPVAHIEDGLGSVGLYYIELLRGSLGCARNELWMDPTKGRFYRGLAGPKCRFWREEDFSIMVPSDVDFLKDDVAIRYFASKEDDQRLLYALAYSTQYEILDDIPGTNNIQVISGLTNSTIAFSKNVRWWSWTDCLDKGQEMLLDGATRFHLRDKRRKIGVESANEPIAWLSQALGVFHAHNISIDEDLSNYKLLVPYLELTGTLQKSKRKHQQRQLSPPIYMFALPSSHPVYYWSFDPTGQTPLSREMCKYLGLPFKLSLKMTCFQHSWPTRTYKHMHDYQIANGFNPKTTDFTQHFGWSTFQIVPPENRFQDLEQDEMVPVESGDPPLPMVHDDLRLLDSNGYIWHQVTDESLESPEEPDDSFSLDLLFHETGAPTNTSHSPDDMESA